METTSLSSDDFRELGEKILDFVQRFLTGKIPTEGTYSAKRWAFFMGNSEDTITRWVDEYRIPYYKPGNTMFIDAVDFRARIPYIEPDPKE